MQEACAGPCCGIPCCGNTEQLVSLKCGHDFCIFCLQAQKKNRLRRPTSMCVLCSLPACSDCSDGASRASANCFCEPLTLLNRADAYRNRKLACRSSVSLRCALCRRQFLLWPSMLQPNERVAGITPPLSHRDRGSDIDGTGSSDSLSSSAIHCRVDASGVSAAARDVAASWQQWDLCWAKVGDWPYW